MVSKLMSDLYIPQWCSTLEHLEKQQIRLGLQGFPGTGKTHESLTFPNPIVLNLDRGLGAHSGRKDVIEIPMWKPEFVDRIKKRDGLQAPPNRKEAIIIWLTTEALKLTDEQTLVVDSNTQLKNALLAWYGMNPVMTKNGSEDGFGLWKTQLAFYGEVCEYFKALKSNVCFICHEIAERENGDLTGGVKPLLNGGFGEELASHFTDWFRCIGIAKPENDDRKAKLKEKFKIDEQTVKEWCANSTNETIYLWQTATDEIAKCKTSSLVNVPKFILANYSQFVKYGKQQITTIKVI